MDRPSYLPSPTAAVGRRVGLRIIAPAAFDLPMPVLEGRLARPLAGYFGLLRYLIELDAPLPDGFDPLGELPWFARNRSVRSFVISPAPDAPTLETPPDVIGDCVRDSRVLHVFVSIGPSARALRVAGDAAASESRCPFLCMADLEPRPATGKIEERHGFAGGLRTLGRVGGPFRGPPGKIESSPCAPAPGRSSP